MFEQLEKPRHRIHKWWYWSTSLWSACANLRCDKWQETKIDPFVKGPLLEKSLSKSLLFCEIKTVQAGKFFPQLKIFHTVVQVCMAHFAINIYTFKSRRILGFTVDRTESFGASRRSSHSLSPRENERETVTVMYSDIWPCLKHVIPWLIRFVFHGICSKQIEVHSDRGGLFSQCCRLLEMFAHVLWNRECVVLSFASFSVDEFFDHVVNVFFLPEVPTAICILGFFAACMLMGMQEWLSHVSVFGHLVETKPRRQESSAVASMLFVFHLLNP